MSRDEMDEMSLAQLTAVAFDRFRHSSLLTDWLEDYHDPAKSALMDLLLDNNNGGTP